MPFVLEMQEDVNLNLILNRKSVKSDLPLSAKNFKYILSEKYGPAIGQNIFNYTIK